MEDRMMNGDGALIVRWLLRWLLLLSVLLGGCGSLPDLKGFADATSGIQTGVVTIGAEFSASIPDDLKCEGENCKARFTKEWQIRSDAIAAIANYSDSLAQIVGAGNAGAEGAERVLNAANSLLGALMVPVLSTAVTAAATKALSELAKFRALRSLDEAISGAHQPIEGVANILQQDLDVLAKSVSTMSVGLEALAEATDQDQVGSARKYAQAVVIKYRSLITSDHQQLAKLAQSIASIRARSDCSADSVCKKDEADVTQRLRAIDQRIADSRTRLAALEDDLKRLEQAYAPVKGKRDAVVARAEKIQKAIAQVKIALHEWIAIHKALGGDVKRGLQPNVRQLVATAAELRRLLDEMRKTP